MVIVCTHTVLCPVSMFKRYTKLAIGGDKERFVFRGILNTNAGARLHPAGGLSYTRIGELVLEKVSEIGYFRLEVTRTVGL